MEQLRALAWGFDGLGLPTADYSSDPVTIQGVLKVEDRWDGGETWVVVSSFTAYDGTYAAQVPLSQAGEVSIKVLFADGSTRDGSISVR